uniref:Retrotransposon protein, putative, unclassified n=1 Tax=Oryza sativa subsp. japonica TaxID=39947 RepID=Q2QSX7_ORYSJ|nr:retrotransposon protein, putative, unclassified [Oryza sativa Japonica Group]
MRNKCFSLSLTDAQLADLAFQGMIAPIREKFSSEDFDSLSHLIQKVTLHEHRSAEVRKSSKRVNHVCPYMYGSDDDEDDPEIAAAKWLAKQPIGPAQGVFRFCWNEGMRLPSIENCPGCSDIVESSSRSYNRGNRLWQTRVSVHQRLGPMNQDHGQEDSVVRKNQWCPSGIFTKNQKRRVQRLRNRECLQEVEQEIDHWLRKAKPRQEWRVKNQVPVADDVAADEAKRKLGRNAEDLIKTNMVFKDFGGNPSETKGILNVELTVGSKTIPNMFFAIDGKGSYSLLLGRDWIHANCCIPSTMHQCLIQWQGDKIEIVPADRSVNVASADLALWEMDGLDCLSVKVWDGDFLKIKRLYDAGFIRPCRYAEWVSSIVPVIKKNGKVRVCIDFRDLNKATPKDEYSMLVADQLVDAASGNTILSFMDGNAGYNQIFMAEEDIHKTAFRCPGAIGLFEWVVMTFGLKSAGATYQRAMNYIYHDLISWLVEVYIDDAVVKSKEIDDHIADLRKVFERTRKYGLKMYPTKCAFGVSAGQSLGFLVHERGLR